MAKAMLLILATILVLALTSVEASIIVVVVDHEALGCPKTLCIFVVL